MFVPDVAASLVKWRATKDMTTATVVERLNDAGIPCGPINNVKQAISHPQVAARNMIVTVPDGSGGTLKLAGNPLKMSAFDDPPTRRPATSSVRSWA